MDAQTLSARDADGPAGRTGWAIGAVSALMLLAMTLAGCGSSVAGKSPTGIWFNQPFIGGWDDDAVAEAHCAEFGKRAVLAGELLRGDRYVTPLKAYNCE